MRIVWQFFVMTMILFGSMAALAWAGEGASLPSRFYLSISSSMGSYNLSCSAKGESARCIEVSR